MRTLAMAIFTAAFLFTASVDAVPPPCSRDAHCDDGNNCTADLCINHSCEYFPDCRTGDDCHDADPCTVDVCTNGCCSHLDDCEQRLCEPLECDADTDCQDNNGCTSDRCIDNCCVVTNR